MWSQRFMRIFTLNKLAFRRVCICVCMHFCVCRLSLSWIQSLWIISAGTPSASLRLGFSKVEKVLSLTGKFPELGTVPYPLKGFVSSTRNIESIIKACTNPSFAYLAWWHPANLLELPRCWAAQLLSILRVKWLIQKLVSSWEKAKVRIKHVCPFSITGQVALEMQAI